MRTSAIAIAVFALATSSALVTPTALAPPRIASSPFMRRQQARNNRHAGLVSASTAQWAGTMWVEERILKQVQDDGAV